MQERKKKININILDFLIIALVALVIVGVCFRGYTKQKDPKFAGEMAEVSFVIQNVQSSSKYCFLDGDTVYSSSLGCYLGTLVGNVEATNAVYYVEDEGEIIKVESPDGSRVDIYGKFECSGSMTADGGFAIDGTQYIAPGMTTYAYFPGIDANILITDVVIK